MKSQKSFGLAITPEVASPWAGIFGILGNLIIAAFIDIDGIMIWGELMILIGLWPIARQLLGGKKLVTA